MAGLLINSNPKNVIKAFMIINSLSNTYPKKSVFEFSLTKKVSAGAIKQITGTNLSLTVLVFRNRPKQYKPKSGP